MGFTSHGEVALCNLQTASVALKPRTGVRISRGDEVGLVMIRSKKGLSLCGFMHTKGQRVRRRIKLHMWKLNTYT